MKNYLLPLLLFVPMWCFGQVKIGNITIDNETAQRYFLDCYQHPDTVQLENKYGLPSRDWGAEQNRLIDHRNSIIINNSIGKVIEVSHHNSRVDTLWDQEIFSDGKRWHSKAYSKIENVSAKDIPINMGYLIPRKPTEIDFIKWSVKNKKVTN